MDAHGNPSFLPWRSFLNFCIEQGLPTNDTWLIAGHSWANAARDTLDELALSGGPTKQALGALDKIVEEGSAAGSVHLPGTYPHADWQGTRIEGFVIAQGEEITPQATQLLLQLRPAMQAAVLPLGSVPEELKEPYRDLAATASWLPAPKLESVTGVQRDTLIAALLAGDFCSANFPLASTHTGVERMNTDEPASDKTGMVVGMETDSGGVACSRKAMQACSAEDLLGMLTQALLSGGDSGALEAAKAVLAAECASATSTEDGSVPMLSDTTQVKAIQALSGVPDTGSTTLRYKKKMSMWSRAEGDEDAVMGYCMMTFVIRNGLQALGFGVPTYMNYVDSLVRSWGLPLQHGNQPGEVLGPAATAWKPEPFVKAFIAASCKAAANGDLGTTTSRAADAFQGVSSPVARFKTMVEGEKEALKVSTVIDTRVKPGAVVEVPFFSNSMVAQYKIGIQPIGRTRSGSPANRAKEKGAKAKGPKVPAVKTAPPPSKRITLLEEDGAANVGDLISDRMKNTVKNFQYRGHSEASLLTDCGWFLNRDRMKNMVKNFQGDRIGAMRWLHLQLSELMWALVAKGNRYWHEVAAAASTHVGAGRITVVVADKNLVPSPPGNIDRALNVMKDAGLTCSLDSGSVGAEGGDKAEGSLAPQWIAVSGFDAEPLRQAAQQLLAPDLAAKLKGELHVTLWHAADPVLGTDTKLLEELLSSVGQEVVVEVIAIDSSPQITAAQVWGLRQLAKLDTTKPRRAEIV
eukprot:gene20786-27612_t